MKNPIGITMGDPAGIGPEILFKLLHTNVTNIRIYTNFNCLKKIIPEINLSDSRLIDVSEQRM